MADTSQMEQLSPSEPQTNGIPDGIDEDEKMKMRPADIDADMREMERRKRVEMIMNSRLFREELERIIETQLKDGSGPAGLLQQISDMMGIQGGRLQSGNVFRSSNCVVPINDIRGVESMGYAKGEKILRCKLAAVYRLMDLYGWTQGIYNHITARLNQDQEHFLVNPFGMLYHEITASSLVKIDMQGGIVESGTTNFGVNVAGFMLHSAIHAARPDVKCIIHVHTPSVLAVSSLKCGLLPLCQEAIVIGEVSHHPYLGGLFEPEEREKIARNLGPVNKVMFLANHGAVCCGETIEEAFYNVYNTVLACETQIKLMPMGVDNLVLVSDENRKQLYEAARRAPDSAPKQESSDLPPSGIKKEKPWRIGGIEFEALMRMLDNAGFRTGYIYRHPLVKGELPRPRNDVEVPPAVSSLGYLLEEEEMYKHGQWKKYHDGRKTHDRTRWLNSPNVYQKVEILETGTPDPKKITKWVADGSPTHTSTPVKIDAALQFVPKNTDPREFKKLQQQIKDNRRADKITSGPQSHILEGVSWEEAKKLQDANISATGDQVILVGAASKGIIQRGFQHNAMVYKTPYAKNPFDTITDEDIEEYKKTVERKQRGESFDEDQTESEPLSSSLQNSRPTNDDSGGVIKSPLLSPTSAASETEEESRDEPRVLRIETKQVPRPSQAEVVLSDAESDFPDPSVERSMSLRYPEKVADATDVSDQFKRSWSLGPEKVKSKDSCQQIVDEFSEEKTSENPLQVPKVVRYLISRYNDSIAQKDSLVTATNKRKLTVVQDNEVVTNKISDVLLKLQAKIFSINSPISPIFKHGNVDLHSNSVRSRDDMDIEKKVDVGQLQSNVFAAESSSNSDIVEEDRSFEVEVLNSLESYGVVMQDGVSMDELSNVSSAEEAVPSDCSGARLSAEETELHKHFDILSGDDHVRCETENSLHYKAELKEEENYVEFSKHINRPEKLEDNTLNVDKMYVDSEMNGKIENRKDNLGWIENNGRICEELLSEQSLVNKPYHRKLCNEFQHSKSNITNIESRTLLFYTEMREEPQYIASDILPDTNVLGELGMCYNTLKCSSDTVISSEEDKIIKHSGLDTWKSECYERSACREWNFLDYEKHSEDQCVTKDVGIECSKVKKLINSKFCDFENRFYSQSCQCISQERQILANNLAENREEVMGRGYGQVYVEDKVTQENYTETKIVDTCIETKSLEDVAENNYVETKVVEDLIPGNNYIESEIETQVISEDNCVECKVVKDVQSEDNYVETKIVENVMTEENRRETKVVEDLMTEDCNVETKVVEIPGENCIETEVVKFALPEDNCIEIKDVILEGNHVETKVFEEVMAENNCLDTKIVGGVMAEDNCIETKVVEHLKTKASNVESILGEDLMVENNYLETKVVENAIPEDNYIKTMALKDVMPEEDCLETKGVEHVISEYNCVETKICEDIVAEGNCVERKVIEDVMTKDRIVETKIVENVLVDNNCINTNVVEDILVEENCIETKVVEDVLVEENGIETKVVEDVLVEENCIETKVIQDELIEENCIETKVVEDVLVEENGIETKVVEGVLVEENCIETKVVEDVLVEENCIETKVVQDELVLEYCVETKVIEDVLVEDNCIETKVVDEKCIETKFVEENCIETKVVEDVLIGGNCIETKVVEDVLVEDNCIETTVVEDVLVGENCVETKVVEDVLVEDNCIETEVVEGVWVEKNCIESKVVEDVMVQDNCIETEVDDNVMVEENCIETKFVEDVLIEENCIETKVVEDLLVGENCIETKVVEDVLVEENCIETKVVEDNCIETKVVEDLLVGENCVETKVVEDVLVGENCVETKIIEDVLCEDNCIETKVVEENCIETKVVEENCIETKVVEENCIETKVVEDVLVEDNCIETKVVEDVLVEDNCIETEVVEGVWVENNCIESKVVEDVMVEDNCIETEVDDDVMVKDNCIETKVVKGIVTEDNPVETKVIEDAVAEDNCVERKFIENVMVKDCNVETKIVEDVMAEDNYVETQVIEDVMVEDNCIETVVVEDVTTEENCMETKVVEDVMAEDCSVETKVVEDVMTEGNSVETKVVADLMTKDCNVETMVGKDVMLEDKCIEMKVGDDVAAEDNSIRCKAVEEVMIKDCNAETKIVRDVMTEDCSVVTKVVADGMTKDNPVQTKVIEDVVADDNCVERKVIEDVMTKDCNVVTKIVEDVMTEDCSVETKVVADVMTKDSNVETMVAEDAAAEDNSLETKVVEDVMGEYNLVETLVDVMTKYCNLETKVVEDVMAEDCDVDSKVVEDAMAEDCDVGSKVVEDIMAEDSIVDSKVVEDIMAEDSIVDSKVVDVMAEDCKVDTKVVEDVMAEDNYVETKVVGGVMTEENCKENKDVEVIPEENCVETVFVEDIILEDYCLESKVVEAVTPEHYCTETEVFEDVMAGDNDVGTKIIEDAKAESKGVEGIMAEDNCVETKVVEDIMPEGCNVETKVEDVMSEGYCIETKVVEYLTPIDCCIEIKNLKHVMAEDTCIDTKIFEDLMAEDTYVDTKVVDDVVAEGYCIETKLVEDLTPMDCCIEIKNLKHVMAEDNCIDTKIFEDLMAEDTYVDTKVVDDVVAEGYCIETKLVEDLTPMDCCIEIKNLKHVMAEDNCIDTKIFEDLMAEDKYVDTKVVDDVVAEGYCIETKLVEDLTPMDCCIEIKNLKHVMAEDNCIDTKIFEDLMAEDKYVDTKVVDDVVAEGYCIETKLVEDLTPMDCCIEIKNLKHVMAEDNLETVIIGDEMTGESCNEAIFCNSKTLNDFERSSVNFGDMKLSQCVTSIGFRNGILLENFSGTSCEVVVSDIRAGDPVELEIEYNKDIECCGRPIGTVFENMELATKDCKEINIIEANGSEERKSIKSMGEGDILPEFFRSLELLECSEKNSGVSKTAIGNAGKTKLAGSQIVEENNPFKTPGSTLTEYSQMKDDVLKDGVHSYKDREFFNIPEILEECNSGRNQDEHKFSDVETLVCCVDDDTEGGGSGSCTDSSVEDYSFTSSIFEIETGDQEFLVNSVVDELGAAEMNSSTHSIAESGNEGWHLKLGANDNSSTSSHGLSSNPSEEYSEILTESYSSSITTLSRSSMLPYLKICFSSSGSGSSSSPDETCVDIMGDTDWNDPRRKVERSHLNHREVNYDPQEQLNHLEANIFGEYHWDVGDSLHFVVSSLEHEEITKEPEVGNKMNFERKAEGVYANMSPRDPAMPSDVERNWNDQPNYVDCSCDGCSKFQACCCEASDQNFQLDSTRLRSEKTSEQDTLDHPKSTEFCDPNHSQIFCHYGNRDHNSDIKHSTEESKLSLQEDAHKLQPEEEEEEHKERINISDQVFQGNHDGNISSPEFKSTSDHFFCLEPQQKQSADDILCEFILVRDEGFCCFEPNGKLCTVQSKQIVKDFSYSGSIQNAITAFNLLPKVLNAVTFLPKPDADISHIFKPRNMVYSSDYNNEQNLHNKTKDGSEFKFDVKACEILRNIYYSYRIIDLFISIQILDKICSTDHSKIHDQVKNWVKLLVYQQEVTSCSQFNEDQQIVGDTQHDDVSIQSPFYKPNKTVRPIQDYKGIHTSECSLTCDSETKQCHKKNDNTFSKLTIGFKESGHLSKKFLRTTTNNSLLEAKFKKLFSDVVLLKGLEVNVGTFDCWRNFIGTVIDLEIGQFIGATIRMAPYQDLGTHVDNSDSKWNEVGLIDGSRVIYNFNIKQDLQGNISSTLLTQNLEVVKNGLESLRIYDSVMSGIESTQYDSIKFNEDLQTCVNDTNSEHDLDGCSSGIGSEQDNDLDSETASEHDHEISSAETESEQNFVDDTQALEDGDPELCLGDWEQNLCEFGSAGLEQDLGVGISDSGSEEDCIYEIEERAKQTIGSTSNSRFEQNLGMRSCSKQNSNGNGGIFCKQDCGGDYSRSQREYIAKPELDFVVVGTKLEDDEWTAITESVSEQEHDYSLARTDGMYGPDRLEENSTDICDINSELNHEAEQNTELNDSCLVPEQDFGEESWEDISDLETEKVCGGRAAIRLKPELGYEVFVQYSESNQNHNMDANSDSWEHVNNSECGEDDIADSNKVCKIEFTHSKPEQGELERSWQNLSIDDSRERICNIGREVMGADSKQHLTGVGHSKCKLVQRMRRYSKPKRNLKLGNEIWEDRGNLGSKQEVRLSSNSTVPEQPCEIDAVHSGPDKDPEYSLGIKECDKGWEDITDSEFNNDSIDSKQKFQEGGLKPTVIENIIEYMKDSHGNIVDAKSEQDLVDVELISEEELEADMSDPGFDHCCTDATFHCVEAKEILKIPIFSLGNKNNLETFYEGSQTCDSILNVCEGSSVGNPSLVMKSNIESRYHESNDHFSLSSMPVSGSKSINVDSKSDSDNSIYSLECECCARFHNDDKLLIAEKSEKTKAALRSEPGIARLSISCSEHVHKACNNEMESAVDLCSGEAKYREACKAGNICTFDDCSKHRQESRNMGLKKEYEGGARLFFEGCESTTESETDSDNARVKGTVGCRGNQEHKLGRILNSRNNYRNRNLVCELDLRVEGNLESKPDTGIDSNTNPFSPNESIDGMQIVQEQGKYVCSDTGEVSRVKYNTDNSGCKWSNSVFFDSTLKRQDQDLNITMVDCKESNVCVIEQKMKFINSSGTNVNTRDTSKQYLGDFHSLHSKQKNQYRTSECNNSQDLHNSIGISKLQDTESDRDEILYKPKENLHECCLQNRPHNKECCSTENKSELLDNCTTFYFDHVQDFHCSDAVDTFYIGSDHALALLTSETMSSPKDSYSHSALPRILDLDESFVCDFSNFVDSLEYSPLVHPLSSNIEDCPAISKGENTVNGDDLDAPHSTFSQSSKEGSPTKDLSTEESPKKDKKKKKGLRTPSFLKKKKEKKKMAEA